MVAFVMAYSFTEPASAQGPDGSDDEDDEAQSPSLPMMVPMADILNHVARNNAHLDFGQDSLKMVATKDIKKVAA
jgi:SET domain-containing protein 6